MKHSHSRRARTPFYGAERLERRTLLSASVGAIALGLDLPDGVAATYSGDAQSVEFRQNTATGGLLGVPTKEDDPDFIILSTGVAGEVDTLTNESGSQGTDLGDGGVDGDQATISFTIPVPNDNTPRKLKIDFLFLSEEYPEFVNSNFNDFFTATVNGTNIALDTSGRSISVNNDNFDGSLATTGTFFDGRTPLLTGSYAVKDGETSLNVVLTIADVGDGRYDSAVLLDNVRLQAQQRVWLNFNGQDVGTFWDTKTSYAVPPFSPNDILAPAGTNLAALEQQILDAVKAKYADFDIDISLTKPDKGEFDTVAIGGSFEDRLTLSTFNLYRFSLGTTPTIREYLKKLEGFDPENFFGQAQIPDVGNLDLSDLAVILSKQHNRSTFQINTFELINTIAHEIGHNLGLRHVSDNAFGELMKFNKVDFPSQLQGQEAFKDQEYNLAPEGIEYPDGATRQNSHDYLKKTLGTKDGASGLAAGASAGKFKSPFQMVLPASVTDVSIGLSKTGLQLSNEVDGPAHVFLHFDSLTAGTHLITLPFVTKGDKIYFMASSQPGGPNDIFTGVPVNGQVDPSGVLVPLFDANGALKTMIPLASGTLASAAPFGEIGITPSDVTSLPPTPTPTPTPLPNGKGTFIDEDGDIYKIKLTGGGTATVSLDDGDADGHGGISQITLVNTTAGKSKLKLSVSKVVGDGIVTVDTISGSGGLKSISAKKFDVTDAGVFLGGALKSIKVRDITGGADVSAGGAASGKTKITARAIGDDSSFTLGTTISTLTVNHADDAAFVASGGITKLKSAGDFGADLTAASLGKATVSGQLTNATWRFAGSVKSITVGAIANSTIFAGVADMTTTLPIDVTEFVTAAKIKKLTVKTSFSNTNVAAASFGKVKIAGVTADNGGQPFGLAAHQIASLKVTEGATTLLKWKGGDDPALLDLPGDGVVSLL